MTAAASNGSSVSSWGGRRSNGSGTPDAWKKEDDEAATRFRAGGPRRRWGSLRREANGYLRLDREEWIRAVARRQPLLGGIAGRPDLTAGVGPREQYLRTIAPILRSDVGSRVAWDT